jgi:membrane-associated phospholipid phosphatase
MGRKAFYRFACAAISFGIACFVIFIVFPNAIKNDFRPTIDPNSKNVFDQLFNLCYSNDALNNAFPSGHWGVTIMVAIGMRAAIFDKRSSYARCFSAVGCYLYTIIICLSTLFVKQHYIFDGLVAVVLVELLWFIFNHCNLVNI